MNFFTVDTLEFGWDDIAAAAEVWQEWQPWEQEMRELLACLQHAQTTAHPVTTEEIRAAVTAFRYAHQLISAQEAQNWLEAHDLTVAELTNYHCGQLLRAHWSSQRKAIIAAHPIPATDLATSTRKFAICSERLSQWTQKLAGRAAVASASGLRTSPMTVEARIAAIEAAFAEQRQRVLTSAAVRTEMAAHQLDWVRYDCQYIWYGVEHLAREAAFCVQEDGLSLADLAWDSRSIVQDWSFYLDELAPTPRARFLAAGRGDVLGPLAMLEGFPLFTVQHKQLPTAADPQIYARAEQALLQRLVTQEMNQRVQWLRQ